MEPLYVNRMLLGEAVLAEWFKAEYARSYRSWRWVAVAAVVLYLVVAGAVFAVARSFGSTLMAMLGGLFLVLAAVFVLVLLLRPRLQLKKLLATSRGKAPRPQLVLVYEEAALPVSGPDADGSDAAERAARRLAETAGAARAMQAEFEQAVLDAEAMETADMARLATLRDELEDLQRRMDALREDAAILDALEGCAWHRLTGLHETKNLYVLSYGERMLLLEKGGFEKGAEADFAVFIAAKYAAAKARRRQEQPEKTNTKRAGKAAGTEDGDAGV